MKDNKKKDKPKYSVWQNVKYIYDKIWKWDKRLAIYSIARMPIIVVIPFVGIFLTSYVVKMVTEKYTPSTIAINIALLMSAILILNAANNILSGKIMAQSLGNRLRFLKLVAEKTIDADFENVESPSGQKKLSKAFNSLNTNDSAAEAIVSNCVNLVGNLFGIVSYAAIIAALNPIIIFVIALSAVLNYFVLTRRNEWEAKNRDKYTPIDRKLDYLWRCSRDFSPAKDIRLYNMGRWFTDLFGRIFKERTFWIYKSEKQGLAVDIVSGIITFLRDLVSYGYLVYLLFANGLPVDRFILYFGIIGGFSVWITGFVKQWGTLDNFSLRICELRDYIDMPDKFNHGKGAALPKGVCDIEFRNVSFKYPESEKEALKNISLHISAGEKLAIVGMNGAGKTTLVKLLCGFYAPTEGAILVNGRNITDYNIYEYYSLFCTVFQDINFLPVSIAQNITFSSGGGKSTEKMDEVLRLSGLKGKIDSLPKGPDTLMGKSVFDDAIELSGGETQKLALARALYKGGKILVLDEPTAALDPIAESEMYMRYNEMAHDKTSIFISHRLASTRFCDRIILIDNGSIIESGSHDALMKKNGKYAEIFNIQSHYYKEEGKDNVGEAV